MKKPNPFFGTVPEQEMRRVKKHEDMRNINEAVKAIADPRASLILLPEDEEFDEDETSFMFNETKETLTELQALEGIKFMVRKALKDNNLEKPSMSAASVEMQLNQMEANIHKLANMRSKRLVLNVLAFSGIAVGKEYLIPNPAKALVDIEKSHPGFYDGPEELDKHRVHEWVEGKFSQSLGPDWDSDCDSASIGRYLWSVSGDLVFDESVQHREEYRHPDLGDIAVFPLYSHQLMEDPEEGAVFATPGYEGRYVRGPWNCWNCGVPNAEERGACQRCSKNRPAFTEEDAAEVRKASRKKNS